MAARRPSGFGIVDRPFWIIDPQALVDKRVTFQFPMGNTVTRLSGTCTQYDPNDGKHFVVYDDGTQKWYTMTTKTFWVDDVRYDVGDRSLRRDPRIDEAAAEQNRVRRLQNCAWRLAAEKAAAEKAKAENDAELLDAAKDGDLGRVETAMETGADIEVKDAGNGNTPLHNACYRNHITLVEALIEKHGANVNATNQCGMTPLHGACAMKGYAALAELLIEKYRANVEAVTKDGKTPLDMAAGKKIRDAVTAAVSRVAASKRAAELDKMRAVSESSSLGHLQQQYTFTRGLRGHNLEADHCLAPCVFGTVEKLYDESLNPSKEAPSMGDLEAVDRMRLELDNAQKWVREASQRARTSAGCSTAVEARDAVRTKLKEVIDEAVRTFDVQVVHKEVGRLQAAETCLLNGLKELGHDAIDGEGIGKQKEHEMDVSSFIQSEEAQKAVEEWKLRFSVTATIAKSDDDVREAFLASTKLAAQYATLSVAQPPGLNMSVGAAQETQEFEEATFTSFNLALETLAREREFWVSYDPMAAFPARLVINAAVPLVSAIRSRINRLSSVRGKMALAQEESNRIGNLPTSPDRSKFDELREIEMDKAEDLIDAEGKLKKKIKRKKTPEEIQAAQDELTTARREAQGAQRQVEAERTLLVSQVDEFPELLALFSDIIGEDDLELGAVLKKGRSLSMYKQLPWPPEIAPGPSRHEVLLCEFGEEQYAVKKYKLKEPSKRRAFLREASLLRDLSKHPNIIDVNAVFTFTELDSGKPDPYT
mmetsp:Transcript_35865/g.83116  ORF Transcript_35865/g.83116 Transcript_35865/m.83116 type:complete len:765 (-) Transcript_35865:1912-4206(-)